ncbi:hypothetical protein PFISCL1PPCAC_18693 [Pristionchus fissidentatus]|uniref:Uncharacterized protein n=1 Tax=Pristionchus fissidentatus TaxID=1538716 RepID=A0AAV5W9A0_9BILA|nr:hypothetical protein PFISCL1PPCAC_18693 [Pristionchus fissidentatus]
MYVDPAEKRSWHKRTVVITLNTEGEYHESMHSFIDTLSNGSNVRVEFNFVPSLTILQSFRAVGDLKIEEDVGQTLDVDSLLELASHHSYVVALPCNGVNASVETIHRVIQIIRDLDRDLVVKFEHDAWQRFVTSIGMRFQGEDYAFDNDEINYDKCYYKKQLISYFAN